jgi:hypothetical protein
VCISNLNNSTRSFVGRWQETMRKTIWCDIPQLQCARHYDAIRFWEGLHDYTIQQNATPVELYAKPAARSLREKDR